MADPRTSPASAHRDGNHQQHGRRSQGTSTSSQQSEPLPTTPSTSPSSSLRTAQSNRPRTISRSPSRLPKVAATTMHTRLRTKAKQVGKQQPTPTKDPNASQQHSTPVQSALGKRRQSGRAIINEEHRVNTTLPVRSTRSPERKADPTGIPAAAPFPSSSDGNEATVDDFGRPIRATPLSVARHIPTGLNSAESDVENSPSAVAFKRNRNGIDAETRRRVHGNSPHLMPSSPSRRAGELSKGITVGGAQVKSLLGIKPAFPASTTKPSSATIAARPRTQSRIPGLAARARLSLTSQNAIVDRPPAAQPPSHENAAPGSQDGGQEASGGLLTFGSAKTRVRSFSFTSQLPQSSQRIRTDSNAGNTRPPSSASGHATSPTNQISLSSGGSPTADTSSIRSLRGPTGRAPPNTLQSRYARELGSMSRAPNASSGLNRGASVRAKAAAWEQAGSPGPASPKIGGGAGGFQSPRAAPTGMSQNSEASLRRKAVGVSSGLSPSKSTSWLSPAGSKPLPPSMASRLPLEDETHGQPRTEHKSEVGSTESRPVAPLEHKPGQRQLQGPDAAVGSSQTSSSQRHFLHPERHPLLTPEAKERAKQRISGHLAFPITGKRFAPFALPPAPAQGQSATPVSAPPHKVQPGIKGNVMNDDALPNADNCSSLADDCSSPTAVSTQSGADAAVTPITSSRVRDMTADDSLDLRAWTLSPAPESPVVNFKTLLPDSVESAPEGSAASDRSSVSPMVVWSSLDRVVESDSIGADGDALPDDLTASESNGSVSYKNEPTRAERLLPTSGSLSGGEKLSSEDTTAAKSPPASSPKVKMITRRSHLSPTGDAKTSATSGAQLLESQLLEMQRANEVLTARLAASEARMQQQNNAAEANLALLEEALQAAHEEQQELQEKVQEAKDAVKRREEMDRERAQDSRARQVAVDVARKEAEEERDRLLAAVSQEHAESLAVQKQRSEEEAEERDERHRSDLAQTIQKERLRANEESANLREWAGRALVSQAVGDWSRVASMAASEADAVDDQMDTCAVLLHNLDMMEGWLAAAVAAAPNGGPVDATAS